MGRGAIPGCGPTGIPGAGRGMAIGAGGTAMGAAGRAATGPGAITGASGAGAGRGVGERGAGGAGMAMGAGVNVDGNGAVGDCGFITIPASGLGCAGAVGKPTELRTRSKNEVLSKGFGMWPLAPASCAFWASKGSKLPAINNTGMPAVSGSAFNSWHTS